MKWWVGRCEAIFFPSSTYVCNTTVTFIIIIIPGSHWIPHLLMSLGPLHRQGRALIVPEKLVGSMATKDKSNGQDPGNDDTNTNSALIPMLRDHTENIEPKVSSREAIGQLLCAMKGLVTVSCVMPCPSYRWDTHSLIHSHNCCRMIVRSISRTVRNTGWKLTHPSSLLYAHVGRSCNQRKAFAKVIFFL